MPEKLLVAFDFDHTIIDGNSDTVVRDLLKKKPEYKPSDCWTTYMQEIFNLLHHDGINQTSYFETITAIPPSPGMMELLQFLNRDDVEVIIVSDSNSIFIEMWLTGVNMLGVVENVYTNQAIFDPSGLLNVSMYHRQTWCDKCPQNLCKGSVLNQHLKKRLDEGVKFTSVAYVGDGRNDFCPSTKISSSGHIFARKGYTLEKLVGVEQRAENDDKNRILANIHIWSSALDIKAVLSELLSCI